MPSRTLLRRSLPEESYEPSGRSTAKKRFPELSKSFIINN